MGRVRRWNREYAKSDFHDVYLAHVKRTHLRNVNFWFLRRRNMRKRDDRFCGIFSNRTCEILKEKSQRCAVDIFKSIWSINRMRFVSNFDNACMFAMCYFFKANSNYFRNATRFGYRVKLYESIRIGGFIDLGWRSSLWRTIYFMREKGRLSSGFPSSRDGQYRKHQSLPPHVVHVSRVRVWIKKQWPFFFLNKKTRLFRSRNVEWRHFETSYPRRRSSTFSTGFSRFFPSRSNERFFTGGKVGEFGTLVPRCYQCYYDTVFSGPGINCAKVFANLTF